MIFSSFLLNIGLFYKSLTKLTWYKKINIYWYFIFYVSLQMIFQTSSSVLRAGKTSLIDARLILIFIYNQLLLITTDFSTKFSSLFYVRIIFVKKKIIQYNNQSFPFCCKTIILRCKELRLADIIFCQWISTTTHRKEHHVCGYG